MDQRWYRGPPVWCVHHKFDPGTSQVIRPEARARTALRPARCGQHLGIPVIGRRHLRAQGVPEPLLGTSCGGVVDCGLRGFEFCACWRLLRGFGGLQVLEVLELESHGVVVAGMIRGSA